MVKKKLEKLHAETVLTERTIKEAVRLFEQNDRPPKAGWDKCMADAKDWATDPNKVCGAIYFNPDSFKPDSPEVGKALKKKYWGG